MLLQLLFDGTKVHWLLDDLEVIWYHQFFRLNGLTENPCRLKAGNLLDHSLCGLLPMIEDLVILFIELWYLDGFNLSLVEEVFGQLRILVSKFLKIGTRNWFEYLAILFN